ncbi:mannobiose 2-epimerase [Marinilabilia salmonicolor]|jgi:mannobiose 2-epimerase|uniref:AGE family epimerase/isomerase n=1 Tax=Marinilabilia salmonicolor TaxID=989 RepID=UPI000D0652AB|nr:AGE family epimerase/isomerase [Marinilabilia salmonicolor]PRZ01352.1 mannobiose 2-epimerase [Marinilabilia salmonicolor]
MGNREQLSAELRRELYNILNFWSSHTVDEEFGGFAGEVDANGKMVHGAEKGLVLNARILWSFSVAYNFLHEEKFLQLAHRAYDYLINHFWDKEYGGLVWAVDYKGAVSNSRKQIYGQGFGIYGLSEYYKATGKQESLDYAIKLFDLIEQHSYDAVHGGYLEALSADWQPLEDMRLSAKDANSPKSMNTHLHILEPYSNLFRVWKNDKLQDRMKSLVRVFLDKILNNRTGHLQLFFDMDWSVQSNMISYGHDIEGAWLVNEAAELVGDPDLLKESQQKTLKMVEAVMNEGMADDHSLFYEYDFDEGKMHTDRHWWVQGEAMVGLLDAYGHSGNEQFHKTFLKTWQYIKDHVVDHENGGWFGLIGDDGKPLPNEVKAGFWKCPYHNTRALIESIERIDKIPESQ